jgi:hypothetical protein
MGRRAGPEWQTGNTEYGTETLGSRLSRHLLDATPWPHAPYALFRFGRAIFSRFEWHDRK